MKDEDAKFISITVRWGKLHRFGANAWRTLRLPIYLILSIAIAAWIVGSNAERFAGLSVNSDLILRYIAVLRWPFLALIALLVLQRYLPDIVKHGFELKYGKGAIKVGPQPSGPTPKEEEVLEEVSQAPQTTSTTTTTSITQQPNTTTQAVVSLDDPELQSTFYKIYTNIHGTQIEAVLRLTTYDDGLPASAFDDLLQRHQANAPAALAYKSVIALMGYLVSFKLVSYDSSADMFKALPAGTLFIAFLLKENLLLRHNNM